MRLTLPACTECRATDVTVTLRTDYVLYLRCPTCGQLWNVPKPGH